MRRPLLTIIIVFVFGNMVTAQPESVLREGVGPGQTWGLCIGIAEYDPADLTLKWSDKDAIEFSAFLRYGLGVPEDHYRILKNREATRANILEHLGWLNVVANQGDRVYIFYSGHGKQNSPILPHDSHNLLPLEHLKKALSKIDAQDVIVFADACYSGRIAGKGARAALIRENLTGLSKGQVVEIANAQKGLVVVTSANGIQDAYESKEQKNGIFTYHLMKALMEQRRRNIIDRDKNGELTLYEVYQDVYQSVAGDSQQEPQISDPEKAKRIVLLAYARPTPIPTAPPEPAPTPPAAPTPVAPPDITPSFDDIEVQLQWQKYLDEMEETFSKVNQYEKLDVPAESKIAGWQRFIETFSADNPYSTRDDELRGTARARIQFWKERLFPTPTPTLKSLTPTPQPQPPTPMPTATPKPVFRINSVVMITGTSGKRIEPMKGIYTLKVGELVTITVTVTKPQNHRISFKWTAGHGELSSTYYNVTRYTPKKRGRDYVLIYIEDRNTGEKLQKPLNITVVP